MLLISLFLSEKFKTCKLFFFFKLKNVWSFSVFCRGFFEDLYPTSSRCSEDIAPGGSCKQIISLRSVLS